MTPELVFRSALSKTLRDGVTLPCGKSVERGLAVRCAKKQMDVAEPEQMCKTCADALREKDRGKRKGKKK